MPVLTIASSKGGPGKTTICQVLAASLAPSHQLAVLDADPTQALSRWARTAYEGAPFETIAEPDETRLAHLIGSKADTMDLVLVDTAGFGNRAATVAMTSADAVLIPTLAGEADVTEAEKTIRLVEGLARAARRDAGRRPATDGCPATAGWHWPRPHAAHARPALLRRVRDARLRGRAVDGRWRRVHALRAGRRRPGSRPRAPRCRQRPPRGARAGQPAHRAR